MPKESILRSARGVELVLLEQDGSLSYSLRLRRRELAAYRVYADADEAWLLAITEVDSPLGSESSQLET